MSMSKVSVIVPIHNMEDYLDRCIASLRKQVLSDIEIILVENGSTDRSLEICQKYASEDSRIKVIHLDEGDVSVARNVGIDAASSEYLGFVDGDDSVSEEMYSTLYGLAVQHNLDVVYSNHMRIYDKKGIRTAYSDDGTFVIEDTKGLVKMSLTHKIPASACTMIVRKCMFDNVRFPEKTKYEDRAITADILACCKRGGYLNKTFYYYYQRAGSTVHTWTWKHCHDYVRSEKCRLELMHRSGLFTEEEKKQVAYMPATWLLRKSIYMATRAKTPEQKAATKEMLKSIDLIPKGCRLKLKPRVIRFILNTFYR